MLADIGHHPPISANIERSLFSLSPSICQCYLSLLSFSLSLSLSLSLCLCLSLCLSVSVSPSLSVCPDRPLSLSLPHTQRVSVCEREKARKERASEREREIRSTKYLSLFSLARSIHFSHSRKRDTKSSIHLRVSVIIVSNMKQVTCACG